MEPAATVAQLAGVDAFGLIGIIVQRAEKVRRNKQECRQLKQDAEAVEALLQQVHREHPAIDKIVEDLAATLRDACALVESCENGGYLRRFFRGGREAEQFRRVRHKIQFYIQLFPVISHIDTTQRLIRIIENVESPRTQNRPSSSRTVRARFYRTEAYASNRLRAVTEPFPVRKEDPAGTSSSGRTKATSSKDDVHLFKPSTDWLTAAGLLMFEFSQLVNATNNFAPKNKIGEGGSGHVYQGVLDGRQVAVKRCFEESCPERSSDFENETTFIPMLRHKNIVKLLGYCTEGKERVLIYEYMAKKSLDKFVFDVAIGGSLNWDTLFRIIEGIAQGVVYLHVHSGLNVIHRDLKPSNILLDSNMNPKISDFGTARFCHPDMSMKADVVAGTYGYMASEYSSKGIFSTKTDVFSFGSLLLEILSGRRNGTGYRIRYRKSLSLHEYAWHLMFMEQSLAKLIHPSLHSVPASRIDHIKRCLHIALLCVQEDPADRPSMWDVVLMLNGEGSSRLLPDPKRPAVRYGDGNMHRSLAELLHDDRELYNRTMTVAMP